MNATQLIELWTTQNDLDVPLLYAIADALEEEDNNEEYQQRTYAFRWMADTRKSPLDCSWFCDSIGGIHPAAFDLRHPPDHAVLAPDLYLAMLDSSITACTLSGVAIWNNRPQAVERLKYSFQTLATQKGRAEVASRLRR